MKKKYLFLLLVAMLFSAQNTNAQDAYIGEIRMFAGNFPPKNWAFCDGQLLNVYSNTALFSLLGTNYGGDGQTNFGLPDLRGRVPVHSESGAGPGMPYIALGEIWGSETTSISTSNLPAHNHVIYGTTTAATSNHSTGAVLADSSTLDKEYAASTTANVIMAPTGVTGNNIPISIMQPYTVVNFIICTSGYFPSRP